MTTIVATVSTIAQLNAEIIAIDSLAAGRGTSTITLTGNIALSGTELEAINLNTGDVLNIIGNGHTLSGGGTTTPERGLFVYAGTVSVANLTIANMDAVGGNGGSGGGGGAGLGGGLFIGANVAGNVGNVTLNNVTFAGDRAQGGNGGAKGNGGGGGGLGGNGANAGATGTGGGGGGVGAGAVGGVGADPTGGAGGAGIIPNAASGGQGAVVSGYNAAPGGSQGGGGSGDSGIGGGGGGGVGGANAGATGGAGGYGGGGGGGLLGGAGGFGGGGGGSDAAGGVTGGIAGFGGGGGAGSLRTGGLAGVGGSGGFGGGKGGNGRQSIAGGGGGGLGAGGDIFVQAGASLTIEGNASTSIANGIVAAGTGATAGQAFGSGIYLQGTGAALIFNSNGTTETIAAPITDDTGSGGTGPASYTKGQTGIEVTGAGTVTLTGTNTYTGGTTLDAGTLAVASAANLGSGAITFNAPGATLKLTTALTSGATFADVLAGFDNNGTIDLSGVTFHAGATAAVSGTTLTLTDGAFTQDFSLSATTAKTFQVFSDGAGGMTLSSVCFLAGTRIATPDGQKRIETLVPGDKVTTLSGEARGIVWVGKGKVLATRGSRTAATPVVIRKGAFADNVPNADLRVTKAHGFYLDGVLIPAEFLVNHRSIVWDDRAQDVEIYHIELESHDVILANGAAAETYRDDGNRWLFQNANAGWGLPPQEPCAPVLTGGPVVDGVWRRLLDRAGPRPGVPLTEDPDLHLLVDGVRLKPSEAEGSGLVFTIRGRPARVDIVSRDAVPAELGIARDPRSLGVALRRLELFRGEASVAVEANDPCLTEGFYAYEPKGNLRWTTGRATLPAELLALPGRGPLIVMLTLAGSTRYAALGALAA